MRGIDAVKLNSWTSKGNYALELHIHHAYIPVGSSVIMFWSSKR